MRSVVSFLVAVVIVGALLGLYNRTTTNAEHAARLRDDNEILAHNQAQLAQERIDRTIADCLAANEARAARIATSEALIRIAAESPPEFFTEKDRLLLAAFVQRANRAIEAVTKPRTCTIAALHLQPLQAIISRDKSDLGGHISEGTTTPTAVRPAPTTAVRPPATVHRPPTTVRPAPTTVPCPKQHGRCPPKG